jgi:hypothetical protein
VAGLKHKLLNSQEEDVMENTVDSIKIGIYLAGTFAVVELEKYFEKMKIENTISVLFSVVLAVKCEKF